MGKRIVGVITARMASRRLPGKVMKGLGDKTVFAHHVERMRAVKGLCCVYLATSAEPENGVLLAEAQSLNVKVHAGAVEDVLARHITIAEIEQADAVLRVTSDCPVFSIEAATEMVAGFKGEDFTYVSNMTMIQGTLSELISTQALRRSHDHYRGPAVTQYIRENQGLFQLRSILIAEHLCRPEYRLTLDYPVDLELFEFIYANLYCGRPIPLAEVYRLLDDNPEIARLNAEVKVKNVNLYGDRLLVQSGDRLPYGRQSVDEADIQAVVEVLRSDWLTTGPKVQEFERAFADLVGVEEAVAVSSGTAALHAAMFAIGISPGDEVIVSPMTFTASANCVIYQGGTPVFADVDPGTLLIDPTEVTRKITPRTKAIIAVDYAGHACDYDTLRALADKHKLVLVADACHSLGGSYKGRVVGSIADLNVFSFHPVKHITTGEGGMITTDDAHWAQQMRIFRNHGITKDAHQRKSWFYEMVGLGYNYRLTDLQCALGISQLSKLRGWVTRRQEIARRYDAAFAKMPEVRPLGVREDVSHAYHLYVIRVESRDEVFAALRAEGIGVNVHYIPVHLHPFYRKRFARCPMAETAYKQIISLPIFPILSDTGVDRVISKVRRIINGN